ncbi:MAG TPA: outer membrane protein assembly factor BamD [Thermoanaerobaculia bacterium]|nr:outer membrane protein assembly factor BamD [Thermoanaerobaculia bacterium]
MMRRPKSGLTVAIGLALAVAIAPMGCQSSTGGAKKPDKITQELLTQPKEVLFEKGKALIAKKKYDEGRKYLNYVFETYPNETIGREALLMVADSYFQQKSTTGYTEARYRYRDYLNRYPGASNRDYARYQFAFCYDKEHERPDRDQTATREAIEQYRALIREFPDSGYAGAARERIRRLTDLLAEHDFGVGYFYLRKGSTAAALSRFIQVEERFPDYTDRDKLYYYQGVALERLGRRGEALGYFGKIVEQFPNSDFAKKAKKELGNKSGEKTPTAAVVVDTKPQSQ